MFYTIAICGIVAVTAYVCFPLATATIINTLLALLPGRRLPPARPRNRLKQPPPKAAPLPPPAEPGVELEPLQITSESPCLVCGAKDIKYLVLCDECDAPHHRDCWDYLGGCATFKCGCTKYKLPESADDREIN